MVLSENLVRSPSSSNHSAPTAPATRAGQGAFDAEDELARLGQFGLEHTDIRDVERYRDERLLGHQRLSLHVLVSHGAILPYLDLRRNPYI